MTKTTEAKNRIAAEKAIAAARGPMEGDTDLVYDIARIDANASEGLRTSAARATLIRYLLSEGWGYNAIRHEFVKNGDRGRPAWWPAQDGAWLTRPYGLGVAVALTITGNRYEVIDAPAGVTVG